MPLWLQCVTELKVFSLGSAGRKQDFMTQSHFITENLVKTQQRLQQRTTAFNLSLLSHTQHTVVTLTQSHTPTTTVSQQTHTPTNTSVSKHTHTTPRRGRLEKFPSTWVTFRCCPPVSLTVCPSVCHVCHVSVLRLRCHRNCACYEEGEI